jgi:C-terminal processing protease CtpA/Prc
VVQQKKPDLHWDAEARVGRIVFYSYEMRPGEHWDPRPDKIVGRCRRALDRWIGMGMRGLVVDLTSHHGGSYRPALHAIGLHVLKGCHLFDWERGKWCQRKTYDGEAEHSVELEPGSQAGRRVPSGGLRRLSTSARVAVVVSEGTSSSGEIAAAMLHGKEGVRTFGSSASTGGALSVNGGIEVAPGIVLNLTQALVRTSDGKLHSDECLHPDEVSGSPVDAAVRWASGKPASSL